MPDSFSNQTPANSPQLIFDVPSELSFWAKEFKVSPSRIKEAVKAVGPVAKDVEAWLARN